MKYFPTLKPAPLPWRASESSGAQIAEPHTFERLLATERKRTDRTGAPFALMVLDISKLPEAARNERFQVLLHTVSERIRETDRLGWYAVPSSLGILFTAFGNAPTAAVEAALKHRIDGCLASALGPEAAVQVGISMHLFPENSPGPEVPFKHNDALYPDVAHGDGKRAAYRVAKRILDITASMVALLIFTPLFVLVSLMIKLDSRGPVFFRQKRIGRFGKEFSLLKFRTMHVNNDSAIHQEYVRKLILNAQQANGSGTAAYKIVNDPRVTSVGRLLRKTSIDEVPQFVNVLLGDMSLVGPRPPIAYEVACYKLWHRRRLVEVKPGITGLWQVFGRSRTTFDDMVRLDLRYARNQSMWLDIKILLKTPMAVFSGHGAC